MKNKRKFILVLVAIILIGAGGLLVLREHEPESAIRQDGKYTYLNGTVTAYDVTPSYSDGDIIFKIDNTAVDIGGGLRPSTKIGEVYGPIQVGDKVRAKLISPGRGYLTVYDCSECYVKKQ